MCSHPRIFNPATPWTRLLAQIGAWLESPTVTLLAERPGYWETLASVCGKGHLHGPQIHDGRIAAICIQHGVTELWSADRDFSRIAGLTVRNPLISSAGRGS